MVGLTTALKIQEQGGYHVTIVAETFPSDPKTIRYTSLWAVSASRVHVCAHSVDHCDLYVGCSSRQSRRGRSQATEYVRYICGKSRELRFRVATEIDQETFKVMWELSAPGGEAEGCFLRVPQTDYFYDGRDTHLDWMPDVRDALLDPDPAFLIPTSSHSTSTSPKTPSSSAQRPASPSQR